MTIGKTISQIGAYGSEIDACVERMGALNRSSQVAARFSSELSADDLLVTTIARQIAAAMARLNAVQGNAQQTIPERPESQGSGVKIVDLPSCRESPNESS
jgi:hypothetical protein